MKTLLLGLLFSCLLADIVTAQDEQVVLPFDTWQVYTSQQNVTALDLLGQRIIALTTGGFFIYDQTDGSVEVFNTGSGKYRSEATAMAVDAAGGKVWLGYADGTLSVFNPETSRFRHFNDISRNDRFISNRINGMDFRDGMLYVATDFGLVLFSGETNVVVDSYTRFGVFPSPVAARDVVVTDAGIFLATSAGVAIGNPQQDDLKLAASWATFSSAVHFQNQALNRIASADGITVVSSSERNFHFNGTVWQEFTTPQGTGLLGIQPVDGTYWLGVTSRQLVRIDTQDFSVQTLAVTTTGTNLSAVLQSQGAFIAGTNNRGFARWNSVDSEPAFYAPNGPSHNLFEQVAVAENGDVVVASSPTPGRFNIGFLDTGFYLFREGSWVNVNSTTTTAMQQLNANSLFTTAVSGDQYFFGSWGGGFYRYDADTEELTRYNSLNTDLPGFMAGSAFMVISGLAADRVEEDYVWVVSRSSATNTLGRYSMSTGEVQTFDRIATGLPSDARYIKVFTDSYGQLWITLENTSEAGRGLLVLRDPEGGPESSFRLTDAEEAGALPDERVNVLVQDRRGEVWVGTDRGVVRYLFPDRITTGSALERRGQPLINADTTAFDRIILRNVRVTAMAVDGNNQKWVGTDGDGMYLIEESGRAILRHFTTENSPITSDVIRSVAINTQLGEVYIASENGFSVYSALEQEGQRSMSELRVYPNPYSYRDHSGVPVVIEGLRDNATVSIMTADGRLVRRFSTRGGRASWDGLDDQGNQVATGVYFVVANENNGSQVGRGRLIMVR